MRVEVLLELVQLRGCVRRVGAGGDCQQRRLRGQPLLGLQEPRQHVLERRAVAAQRADAVVAPDSGRDARPHSSATAPGSCAEGSARDRRRRPAGRAPDRTSAAAASMSAEAVTSAGGAAGFGGASSAPCGSAWNRHITYIMIDFLSGRGVWTSADNDFALRQFPCRSGAPRLGRDVRVLKVAPPQRERHGPSGSSSRGMPRCACASAKTCSNRATGACCSTAA